jgi:exopolysaccharide biosynthesis polyprenyl glycosylphosphotransferase
MSTMEAGLPQGTAPPRNVVAIHPHLRVPTTGVERRRNPLRLALMSLDLVTIAITLSLATVAFVGLSGPPASTRGSTYFLISLVSMPGWSIAFTQQRLYSSRYLGRAVDELRRLFLGVVLGVAYMAVASVVLKTEVDRAWFVIAGAGVMVTVGIERAVVRRAFRRWRASGRMQRKVVIVGHNAESEEIANLLGEQPQLGYSVVGLVQSSAVPHDEDDLADVVEATIDLVHAEGASSVIIAASAIDVGTSNRLTRELADHGIHVEMSSTLLDIAVNRITVHALGRFPVMHIQPVQRDGWRSHAKRVFDVVLAAAMLVVTVPLVAIAAIAIKLTSRGPVFFSQTRVGKYGQTFTLYKLRTMVNDAEAQRAGLQALSEADGPLFKMKADPRITSVGRILRSLSIDELPQLWNVLKGEMALVGPRPALPEEVEGWPTNAYQRLRVLPGVTGMWQVSGRSSTRFDEYVRLDLYYVDNWSLVTDVAIILRTVPSVFSRRGSW